MTNTLICEQVYWFLRSQTVTSSKRVYQDETILHTANQKSKTIHKRRV